MHKKTLIAQLESRHEAWKILEQTPSTNTFLLEGAFPPGTVCIAYRQSAGRGRFGRPWLSLDKGAFLFSALLRLPEKLQPLAYVPLLTGVSALQALRKHRNDFAHILPEERKEIKLQLKWPNDIYMIHSQGYGKLGGILIEGKKSSKESIQEKAYVDLVLGLGINWSGSEEQLKAALSASNSSKKGKEAPPCILYANFQKKEEAPSPLSFAPYLVETLNQGLLKLQSKNFDFMNEARDNFFLKGRFLRRSQRVYRVKGLSDKCELLLEDMESGKYEKIYGMNESFELLE